MKLKYPIRLLLTALVFSSKLCFGQVDPKIAHFVGQFASQLRSDVDKDDLHGSMSTAIIKNNRIVWSGAFGYADSKRDIPADTGTIYRIGSITKTFTATLLMLLVEEGKIKLDDKAELYVPEIKNLRGYGDYPPITIRQLASHTAGLKREPDINNAAVGPNDQWDSKLITCIPYTSFNSKPGQQYLYSNIGFAILGLALQRAANTPFMDMMQQRILSPLHMDQTFYNLTAEREAKLAEGLDNENTKGQINLRLPLQERKGRGYRVPNGNLYSTPQDLAKFVMSLMGKPPLLTAKSRKLMKTVPDGGKFYGLGLMLLNNPKYDIFGHDGSVPGYTSQFAIDQGSGYAVILMRNYNKGVTNLGLICHNLLKQLNQAD